MNDEAKVAGTSREQRTVIARVYDHFHPTGVWPTFGQLDRPLYNEDQIEIVSVLRSTPNTLVLFDRSSPNPPYESPIQLRLAAIASCVGSERPGSLLRCTSLVCDSGETAIQYGKQ